VDEGQNVNVGGSHLIDQPISAQKQFAYARVIEFRNDTAAFAEGAKRGRRFEGLSQQALTAGLEFWAI
jgi:hypothetical protein